MLQVGKYNICTVTEFLAEGLKEAGDVTFLLFGTEIYSGSVIVPEKMKDALATKRIRTQLPEKDRAKGNPVVAFVKVGRAVRYQYTSVILESERSKYKFNFAPAATFLSLVAPTLNERRPGAISHLFLVNLDDSEGSIAACLIHDGQEQITRVFNPDDISTFFFEIQETVTQIKRDFSNINLEIVHLGFPEDFDFSEISGICQGISALPPVKMEREIPGHSHFYKRKHYPVKSISVVFAAACLLLSVCLFVSSTFRLSWAIVEKHNAEEIHTENARSVQQQESLISGYEETPAYVNWDHIKSGIAMVRDIVSLYPVTFSEISLNENPRPDGQRSMFTMTFKGRIWALENTNIDEYFAGLAERAAKFGANVLDPVTVNAEPEDGWFYKEITIERKVLASDAKFKLNKKNKGLGKKSASLEGHYNNDHLLSHHVPNESIYEQEVGSNQEHDSVLGEGFHQFFAKTFDTIKYYSPGAIGIRLGMAYKNQGGYSGVTMGGTGSAELQKQHPDTGRIPPMEGGSPINSGRPVFPGPSETQTRASGQGVAVERAEDENHDNGFREDGVTSQLLMGKPAKGSKTEADLLRIEYKTIQERNAEILKEMEELRKEKAAQDQALTTVNPTGYFLVSSTPKTIVLADQNNNHLFVNKGDIFFYRGISYELKTINMGKQVMFIGPPTAEGTPKLVFIQGRGTTLKEGIASFAVTSAPDPSLAPIESMSVESVKTQNNGHIGAMPKSLPGAATVNEKANF